MGSLVKNRVYRASTGLVKVAPHGYSAGPQSLPWGGANGYREFVTVGHAWRMQKSGIITQVKVQGPSSLTGQGFYLRVWRRRGGAGSLYDGISASPGANLIGQITAGAVSTVTLSPGLPAAEGDYLGYRLDGNAPDPGPWTAAGSVPSTTTYFTNNVTPGAIGFAWEAQFALAGDTLPIEVYMSAPTAVIIGDSIVSGFPNHVSFLETTETTNLEVPISTYLMPTLPSVLNAGISGNLTSDIVARFTTDCLAYNPRYAIIEGGTNDIATGVSSATILANWTTLLTAAQAAGVQAVILLILPRTALTNGQSQQRDSINASLTALAATYGAIVVNADSAVGLFRAGGDAGNHWDIQAAYGYGDGTHYNQAGHTKIAQTILTAMRG